MVRLPDCPGDFHRTDEGEHHGESCCPWEETAPPEGQTREEYHPECRENQLRGRVANLSQTTQETPAGICALTGKRVRAGGFCWENPEREICRAGCDDYRLEA